MEGTDDAQSTSGAVDEAGSNEPRPRLPLLAVLLVVAPTSGHVAIVLPLALAVVTPRSCRWLSAVKAWAQAVAPQGAPLLSAPTSMRDPRPIIKAPPHHEAPPLTR